MTGDKSNDQLLSEANQMELQVYEALKQVMDPEIGINIVDLGLVYIINYDPGEGIRVEMTLTSKGCPLGESILSEVKNKLISLFPKTKIDVKLVWEPAWTLKNVTPSGMKQLGN